MAILNPTPRERLLDDHGRPYFLWDVDMTLARFQELLRVGDRPTRVYLIAKLMRQAKPDDVFRFVDLQTLADVWPEVRHDLGDTQSMWTWLLRTWRVIP